jgi:hypothetical protein
MKFGCSILTCNLCWCWALCIWALFRQLWLFGSSWRTMLTLGLWLIRLALCNTLNFASCRKMSWLGFAITNFVFVALCWHPLTRCWVLCWGFRDSYWDVFSLSEAGFCSGCFWYFTSPYSGFVSLAVLPWVPSSLTDYNSVLELMITLWLMGRWVWFELMQDFVWLAFLQDYALWNFGNLFWI